VAARTAATSRTVLTVCRAHWGIYVVRYGNAYVTDCVVPDAGCMSLSLAAASQVLAERSYCGIWVRLCGVALTLVTVV